MSKQQIIEDTAKMFTSYLGSGQLTTATKSRVIHPRCIVFARGVFWMEASEAGRIEMIPMLEIVEDWTALT